MRHQAGLDKARLRKPLGRYHRNLHACLSVARIDTVLVNPLRSRRSAEAIGQLAKNDRVDTSVLAHFGQLEDLDPTLPGSPHLHLHCDLLVCRRKLVQ